jgi:CDP-diacylglycerol--glycerol-3-phosphate 3-phosphatidyltransferase
MTVPNWITLFRILLIPVFVSCAIYYGRSLQAGSPVEWQRWAAVAAFMVAALSDGIDGYIARRYNLGSALGRVLDPIADKGLMLAAILTLSLSDWHFQLPIWFAVLLITRDIVILLGVAILHHLIGKVEIRPSKLGKICTFAQMFCICWVLFLPRSAPQSAYMAPVWVAAALTVLSGVGYIIQGVNLLREGGHSTAQAGGR